MNTVKGSVELRTCRGNGASAATNGQGGDGTLKRRGVPNRRSGFLFLTKRREKERLIVG